MGKWIFFCLFIFILCIFVTGCVKSPGYSQLNSPSQNPQAQNNPPIQTTIVSSSNLQPKFFRGDYYYPNPKSLPNIIYIISDYNPQSDTYAIIWAVYDNINGTYIEDGMHPAVSREGLDNSYSKAGHIDLDNQIPVTHGPTEYPQVQVTTETPSFPVQTQSEQVVAVTTKGTILQNAVLVDEDFIIISNIPKGYDVRGPKNIHFYVATSDVESIVDVRGWKSEVKMDRFGNEVIVSDLFNLKWIYTADRFSVVNEELSIPENTIYNIQLMGRGMNRTGINNGHILIETL